VYKLTTTVKESDFKCMAAMNQPGMEESPWGRGKGSGGPQNGIARRERTEVRGTSEDSLSERGFDLKTRTGEVSCGSDTKQRRT